MITSINQLDLSKKYSYADYLVWQFQERVELIKGDVYVMIPSPTMRHQLVAGDIHTAINTFLKKNKCKVFSAPFDVRLMDSKKKKNNKSIFTVVQPDICVVCDETKLDERGCIGAPDIMIEVVSLYNTQRDIKQKFELYLENQVPEYWIVLPYDGMVQIFDLENEKYQLRGNYNREDKITMKCLPGFSLDLADVFYHE
jgi:Uma2 family endonuclease